MTKCNKCDAKNLKASDFNKKNGKRIGQCKACQSKYWRRYYSNSANRRKHVKRNHARVTLKRREDSEFVNTLKDKPCLDCGREFPPCAMQFDHVRGKKIMNVSRMAKRTFSRKKLLAEIAKCELVCANCHAIRTFITRA